MKTTSPRNNTLITDMWANPPHVFWLHQEIRPILKFLSNDILPPYPEHRGAHINERMNDVQHRSTSQPCQFTMVMKTPSSVESATYSPMWMQWAQNTDPKSPIFIPTLTWGTQDCKITCFIYRMSPNDKKLALVLSFSFKFSWNPAHPRVLQLVWI